MRALVIGFFFCVGRCRVRRPSKILSEGMHIGFEERHEPAEFLPHSRAGEIEVRRRVWGERQGPMRLLHTSGARNATTSATITVKGVPTLTKSENWYLPGP